MKRNHQLLALSGLLATSLACAAHRAPAGPEPPAAPRELAQATAATARFCDEATGLARVFIGGPTQFSNIVSARVTFPERDCFATYARPYSRTYRFSFPRAYRIRYAARFIGVGAGQRFEGHVQLRIPGRDGFAPFEFWRLGVSPHKEVPASYPGIEGKEGGELKARDFTVELLAYPTDGTTLYIQIELFFELAE